MVGLLHDPDAFTRQAVVDSLSEKAIRDHLDEVFQMMLTDPDLNVREAGFRRFNALRKDTKPEDQIENLDSFSAVKWWNAHRSEMVNGK
jgi:hypothetical protein